MSPRLGITMASYGHRWRNRKEPATQVPEWQDALDVLDHCANLGAGCLQIGVNKWTTDFAGKVRSRREALGIELEGQIRLPWKAGDLERFESDLLAAKEAGASVVRAVCLGGRRYESFETRAEWDQFVENSYKALERAEPVLARCQMRLGVENHKDWRADEHLALLRHLDSEYVGITFDFGNNLALLEDPVSQAEKLAPFIVSTHTKDMALAEFEEGFLLSEVPLGTGRLDLVKLMKICQEANPQVWFNLEMITRDPLKVPVLTQPYWETFDSIPARDLADRIALAKQGSAKALPQIEGLSLSETIRLEETHVRESFANSARMPVAN
ncbi:MAG: TIM barrel protein [Verrucomicrobiota bacterium]